MSVGESIGKEERPPYIRFEKKAIENKVETLKQGHYVATDVDYVFVTLPGGRDVFASTVDKWLERQEVYARSNRIKPEWLDMYKKSYERWKNDEEIPENGTPIRGWVVLSPAQTDIILHAGIRTVEDLAVCNDEAMRRLGMGGRDLVNKAKSWLRSASDHGQVALQNAALEKENENLKVTVSSLEEKVEILMRKVDSISQQDVPRGTISAADLMPETTQDEMRTEIRMESLIRGEIEPGQDFTPAQLYEQKFGKPPHHRMKEATIRAKLEE